MKHTNLRTVKRALNNDSRRNLSEIGLAAMDTKNQCIAIKGARQAKIVTSKQYSKIRDNDLSSMELIRSQSSERVMKKDILSASSLNKYNQGSTRDPSN